ncbi:hypothetical protein D3C71_1870620 [compost metagenome]
MHTVCDVRNLNLYKDLAPAEIWRSYRRALNQALDNGDKTRAFNPDFGRQPEYAGG